MTRYDGPREARNGGEGVWSSEARVQGTGDSVHLTISTQSTDYVIIYKIAVLGLYYTVNIL